MNSWSFRAVTLGMGLLLCLTVVYTLAEFIRLFRRDRKLDEICSDLFLGWTVVLEALITFMGLYYLLGRHILW